MPLTWQKRISKLMKVCRDVPYASPKFVFAVSQDCENLYKMASNSNRLFSHCFRKTKNQQLEFLLSCWFSMWTSLGLNQGPPDYESVALTN